MIFISAQPRYLKNIRSASSDEEKVFSLSEDADSYKNKGLLK